MKLGSFLAHIKEYRIPPTAPDLLSGNGYRWNSLGNLGYIEARGVCTSYGMWAIVTQALARSLAGWIDDRVILEVMAGAGWLAKALSNEGVHIIATDNASWDSQHAEMKRLYSIIEKEASEAIETYGHRTDVLIVSWPPYDDDTICEACGKWGSVKPIVYIGEGHGGCNAPDEFFDHFREVEDAPYFPLMSWDGLHDHVFIGHWR